MDFQKIFKDPAFQATVGGVLGALEPLLVDAFYGQNAPKSAPETVPAPTASGSSASGSTVPTFIQPMPVKPMPPSDWTSDEDGPTPMSFTVSAYSSGKRPPNDIYDIIKNELKEYAQFRIEHHLKKAKSSSGKKH